MLAKPKLPLIRTYAPTVGRLETDFSDDFFPELRPDPYPDYARRFTEEGGVEIIYKDIDQSLPRTLGKIALWLLAMLATAAYLRYASPLQGEVSNGIALFVMAVIYTIILWGATEVYRRVEIRPDCMIIDGIDVFWAYNMEAGFPSFQMDAEGNLVLCGIYGTRWVEYFTVRRFDDFDRTPELLARQLQDAMHQHWSHPSKGV